MKTEDVAEVTKSAEKIDKAPILNILELLSLTPFLENNQGDDKKIN